MDYAVYAVTAERQFTKRYFSANDGTIDWVGVRCVGPANERTIYQSFLKTLHAVVQLMGRLESRSSETSLPSGYGDAVK